MCSTSEMLRLPEATFNKDVDEFGLSGANTLKWVRVLHFELVKDILSSFPGLSRHDKIEVQRALRDVIRRPGREYLTIFDLCEESLAVLFREGPSPTVVQFAGFDWNSPNGLLPYEPLPCPIETYRPAYGRCVKAFSALAIASNATSIRLIRDLYQIAAFPLRVNAGTVSPSFDKLRAINMSRNHKPSNELKSIIRSLLGDDFENIVVDFLGPHHGPGAVGLEDSRGKPYTKRLTPRQKDHFMDFGSVLYLMNEAGLSESPLFSNLVRWAQLPDDSLESLVVKVAPSRPSQVIAVPKSWKKLRNIAVEPLEKMWLQQAAFHGLQRALQLTPIRKYVDLADSRKNREAARWGSLTGRLATIDLSDASDSVGFEFAKELFEQYPRVWRIFETFRSTKLKIQEDTVPNNLFATMGNAFCFPVETIIFTAIALEACERNEPSTLRVYGDDIVLPGEYAPRLIELLTSYGFTVNRRKTFYGSQTTYRESCGGEYLCGLSIEPLRLPRSFAVERNGENLCLDVIGKLRALLSEAYERGFQQLASCIASLIARRVPDHLIDPIGRTGISDPFASDWGYRLSGVYDLNGPNKVWLKDLQKVGFLGTVIRPKTRPEKRNSIYALLEWFWRKDDNERFEDECVNRGIPLKGAVSCKYRIKVFAQREPSRDSKRELFLLDDCLLFTDPLITNASTRNEKAVSLTPAIYEPEFEQLYRARRNASQEAEVYSLLYDMDPMSDD